MKKILLILSVVLLFVACDDNTSEPTSKEGNDTKTSGSKPVATMTLEDGSVVVIELDADSAPNTVANFISLANSGFYDGLTFHRIIEDFMIQGGDPDGNGTGGPGYSIPGEMYNNGFTRNTLKNTEGTIAMARSQSYDSAGSQFFINVNDNTHLDNEYTVFGEVTDGYDTVKELSTVQVDGGDKPVNPVVIKSIVVDTKGVKYPEPTKSDE